MPEGADLRGLGVVVTRPAHQARGLVEALERAGARPIAFPALEIVPPRDLAALDTVIDRLHEYDLAIFISPNAVEHAVGRIRARRGDLPAGLRVAAVGRGSARELKRLGVGVDIVPPARADSEALLALPELQEEAVRGRRVVIFRGEGGRELLAETLRARGARVDYGEAYRRARPQADVGVLLRHWARGEIDLVTVTSNEALTNLFEMVGQLGRRWLRDTPLVVTGERQAALARELGMRGEVRVAGGAGDEQLMAAIAAWARAHREGQAKA